MALSDRELADRHKYRLLSGEIAVSITRVCGLLDLGKSAAFAGAAAKLTRQGLNYRAEWKAKADRGTRVHRHFESFLRGEDIEVLDEDAGFVDALERAMLELDLVPLLIEQPVISELGYGGRPDLVAGVRNRGVGVVELKTGREDPVNHSLQLAAQRFSDGAAEFDDAGMLIGVTPLPSIDFAAALYAFENGSYRFVEYPADERAFVVFCALLEAWKWTCSEEMLTLTKEAKK